MEVCCFCGRRAALAAYVWLATGLRMPCVPGRDHEITAHPIEGNANV